MVEASASIKTSRCGTVDHILLVTNMNGAESRSQIGWVHLGENPLFAPTNLAALIYAFVETPNITVDREVNDAVSRIQTSS